MNSAPGFQGARDDLSSPRRTAADPATWNDLINYIPTVVMGTGMGGLWILAYLKDWIVSAKTHESKCKEVDARTAGTRCVARALPRRGSCAPAHA